MKRLRSVFYCFLAVLVLVEVIVVSLELLVPSEFKDRHATLFGLFEPHPELGFRARPNLRDFEVTWRNNSLRGVYNTDEIGFRNVGRFYQKSEIYFIGDSFTWGAWIAREDTFPDKIGKTLGVPVSNLGQESYYVEQYLKVARLALKRGTPSKVAVCLFANDLTAPLSDEDLKHFYERFKWDQYRYYPIYKRTFSYWAIRVFVDLIDHAVIAFGWKSSPAPSHLDRRIDPDTGMEFYRQLGAHPGYFQRSFNVAVEEKFLTLLREIQRHGSEPLVFLLPSKESAYKHVYTKLFSDNYLAIEETGYSRLCRIARDNQFKCVDLTSAFRLKSKSADVYFHFDPHWNVEGHRLAASEMTPYFR